MPSRPNHPKAESLEGVLSHRVVPVVTVDTEAQAVPLAKALVEGGLPVAEVTFRTPAALAALTAMGAVPGLVVGAGTVVTGKQVDEAVAGGARFVVSPGLSPEVVSRCREHRTPVMPGVATASEVMAAMALDLTVLKYFPAEAMGGLTTISYLAAAFPSIRFVPTGGIGNEQIPDYLAHPAVAAVGGSWMVPSDLIRRGDFDEIRRRVARVVELAAPG